MLVSLKVQNYALISDVDLTLDRGMTIITGETGAGKSILIDALGLALGERADTSVLRNKGKKCVIEAQFDISRYGLEDMFVEWDLDYETFSLLRREISETGKSRAFVNDSPVNLNVLQQIGAALVEIHSQHDNLQLFKPTFQFACLDAFAMSGSLQKDYKLQFGQWKESLKKLEDLQESEAELSREADFNRFLWDELESAALREGEEEVLEQEQELLQNSEGLIQLFSIAASTLSESEYAILNRLEELKQQFGRYKTEYTTEIYERLQALIIELKDISGEVGKLSTSVEVNPQRLEDINARMALIFQLKSKHRAVDTTELIRIKYELEDKLGAAMDLSAEIKHLLEETEKTEKALATMAIELEDKRRTVIPEMEAELNRELADMGMQHSLLKFELEQQRELGEFGFNRLQVLLSSDKGKSYAELKKSASGGELSRINLSFKSRLAAFIPMPTSVLDEIDTGVSGEIARRVGMVMRNMATKQQVIVITHLPQIASLGNAHLFVYKSEREGLVNTEVKPLNKDERIHEIAKMISGEHLTESAIEQSKELLKS